MDFYIGIDGGGTKTTVGICDATGAEVIRRLGPAGIVDARRPTATAELLVELVAETIQEAGLSGSSVALCAGLAGVGNPAERDVVEAALKRSGVAREVRGISDGEAALYGALGVQPGILVISGTGSVAYGRAEDGRVARCGGWGMYLGDEGGGYAIGASGLRAALMAADGRGPATELLGGLLDVLGLATPEAVPPWVSRADKADVARLAMHIFRIAEHGDAIAREIVTEAALDLAAHVDALLQRLGPWTTPPAVVLHGGVANDPVFAPAIERVLRPRQDVVRLVPSLADAVSGALQCARLMVGVEAE